MGFIFNAIVVIVISFISITNFLIVITLFKSKSFNRSTKMHLSLFTICDFCTGILIGIKVLLEENEYVISSAFCKVIVGLILLMSNVMCNIYTSMTLECMSMLSLTGKLSQLRFFVQNGWKISQRGFVTIIILIVHPTVANIGLIIPFEIIQSKEFECLVNTPSVYHPLAFKVWTGQLFTVVSISIILIIWLVHQLKKANRHTEALFAKAKAYTGNTTGDRKGNINANKKRLSSVHLTILAAAFYTLCYGPYVLMITLFAHCPENCGINNGMIKGASTIICLHGLLNAFVYMLKNKDFKKSIMETFCLARSVQPDVRK